MAAKTPAAKKRKIVQENRVFNEDWTTKYFFVERKRKAVCVICSENVRVLRSVFFIPVNVLGFTPDISSLSAQKQHQVSH